MHLDSWVFSIFPKISRAIDARNSSLSNYFRHLLWRPSSCFYRNASVTKFRRHSTFNIPDLKAASTSAYIVKSGFNKVWQSTSNSKAHSRPSGPGVPSVPLQKYNETLPPKASQHGRIPAGQYPFHSSESPLSSLKITFFDFLPNTVSPSQSLLFQPPSPPLPPVSLSPLPIHLSSFSAPPPQELVIKIAGPEGYLNDDHHNLKSQITTHFQAQDTEVANSLVVIWQSRIDGGGRRGLESLKALFSQLDEKVLDSDRTALSRFTKLSFTIPDQVKDVAPYNDLPKPVKEDDIIDLSNAMDLREFAWHGDFVIFATKFKNLSFVTTLTGLNIKSCNISIEDAITLLHSCSSLQTACLGTIRSEEDCGAIMSMKSRGGGRGVERRKPLPNLTYLALESDVALHPLIRRFCWTAQVSLNLTLRKQGTSSLVQALDSASQT